MPRYDYVVSQDGGGDFRTLAEAMEAIARQPSWRRLWRSLFGGWVLQVTASQTQTGYFAGFRMSDVRIAEAQASPIPFHSARICIDAESLRS